MHIRPAQAEDAQALAGIAQAAKAFWNYTPAQLETWREALSPTVTSIVEQPTQIVERNGMPAGFYQLQLKATPAELEHLWVHPRYMGQGLGSALLAHALQHLANLGLDSLHIDADPHAECFYRRRGAQRIAEIAAPIEGQPDRVRPQLCISGFTGSNTPSKLGEHHPNKR